MIYLCVRTHTHTHTHIERETKEKYNKTRETKFLIVKTYILLIHQHFKKISKKISFMAIIVIEYLH